MKGERQMVVKEGFVLRNMGGQPVVVSVGSASKVFNGMIKLNESGEYLWNILQNGAEKEDLVQALLKKYEVSKEVAEQDVDAFLRTLSGPGIIE